MKKILILLLLVTISCKHSNDKEVDPESMIEIDSSTTEIENTSLVPNFEVSDVLNSEFYTDNEYDSWTIYNAKFKIKNKTNYKVNKFFIEDSLSIISKNDEHTYFTGVTFKAIPPINIKTPWLPNTEREFEIFIPDSHGMVPHLNPNQFERTPDKISLFLKYNWFSLDNEGKESENFDIMQEWQDYQKKLGIR